ncbi:hypothetical protein PISMIDRAFT_637576 [Pisolithus microcarpus 441]|uniref:Uncharacterized protein n=1 Tax=Pisolithus microcarpus 441 TaxID=765257 RepID=A0A0C9YHF9_9AGAM|nr:hypothetical protein PISMIDRAFT_637576 [Pisolithus microcarpus 441]
MEPDGPERIEFSGELGVVYRHMNRLEDAKRAFEDQYNTAKRLSNERAQCRAVGNLGMVNYQLSGQSRGPLLDLAIEQLTERVTSVRRLKAALDTQSSDPSQRHLLNTFTTWEMVGLSRLSLCYTARGEGEQAIKAASEGVELTTKSADSTAIAMSRLFYGRALLLDGQHQEALKQFNPPNGCTPTIALCKEPSEEHRSYLAELVDAGADMDVVDEQDSERLGIWIDKPAPGVAALPMIIAQCNALISLVDDAYHTRAWCSVEVMMVQTLRRSYNLHMWYEHVPSDSDGGTLREGPIDWQVVMKDKQLTYESDRPKVLFLERQSKLLG